MAWRVERRTQALVALALLVGAGFVSSLAATPAEEGGYTGMEFVKRVAHGSGAGLWLHQGYAYVSALGSGFFVVDIRNPENPVKVGQLGGISSRGVDILEVAGKTVAVLAPGVGTTMTFVDVTDPTRPTTLKGFNVGAQVHNLAVIPGTPYVYNARGGNQAGALDIIDASDPANPVVVKRWQAPGIAGTIPTLIQWGGCHEVTIDLPVHRAYCPAGQSTLILDITDILNPVIVSAINNPAITFHHTSFPNADHTVLMVGDEILGAGAPGCFAAVDTPVNTLSTPTGAVWFYDISNEALPVPVSWVSAPTRVMSPCTAHSGTMVGTQDLLAIGWYLEGVQLIDFSIPSLPHTIDRYTQDADVWDVKYADGYLFTGTIGRGMDVLRLV